MIVRFCFLFQAGYLQVRDPIVVNVTYFFSFVDDPTVSAASLNIQRAATLLFAAAQFRKLVVSGQLPHEKIGKEQTPLDATAYKYMFNACRIPRRDHDGYRIYDPSLCTHAVVARKGHFFSIQCINPTSGNPLQVGDLEEQLRQCIVLADSIPSSRPKLGIMTTNNRDDWADARDSLLRMGGVEMEEALEKLESGALLLNLDDETPVSRQELGELYWTGGLNSGPNRWFDKSIQIMVASNGKAGLCAEHSMMDGMPVINFADFITKMTYSKARSQSMNLPFSDFVVIDIFGKALTQISQPSVVHALESKGKKKHGGKFCPWSEAGLHLSHRFVPSIAWQSFHELITAHSLHAQSFQGYGSSLMKKMGFPPDAYVQTAMQLATYRLFGEQVGTYEATQVRKFLHGRTEVTRGVSTDTEAFIKMMSPRRKFDEDNAGARKAKIRLLRQATKAHAKCTGMAANAQGVDRHLFGLSMMLREGEEAPRLFSDPVYRRSKHWRSSTSQLSHPRFNLWGYGEVVPDGVGLAYSILPQSCVFNITALKSTGFTDKLSDLLEEALLEMRQLVEADQAGPSSRL